MGGAVTSWISFYSDNWEKMQSNISGACNFRQRDKFYHAYFNVDRRAGDSKPRMMMQHVKKQHCSIRHVNTATKKN